MLAKSSQVCFRKGEGYEDRLNLVDSGQVRLIRGNDIAWFGE